MPESDRFSLNDGAICKRCKDLFSFRQSYRIIEGLKFPNGDFSLVKAACPKCFSQSFYTENDILHTNESNEDKDELIKQLRSEIAQLKLDKDFLKNRFEDLFKAYSEEVNKNNQNQPKPSESSQFKPVG
jgi:hypothetical protein